MRNTVGGIQRPKNENLSNVVEEDRERMRLQQESGGASPAKVRTILIEIGLIAVLVVVLLLVLASR